jgi:hypothetical protein
MRLSPEDAYGQILQQNPMVSGQMPRARRVTQVHATGEFSFRSKRFTGDRWVLAGDAAGFIDPVWSSGVFIAVLSGEKAAEMLDRVLREPARRPAEFNRYERRIGQVMDLYLRFVTARGQRVLYGARVLGMTKYLNEPHLVKQGLRFWFTNDEVTSLADAGEVGRALSSSPTIASTRSRHFRGGSFAPCLRRWDQASPRSKLSRVSAFSSTYLTLAPPKSAAWPCPVIASM